METWEHYILGDLVATQKGYAFKSAWYTNIGRPIVKVSDFTLDSVEPSGLVCIPEDIAANYLKYALAVGDVVVQTVGSWPTNPASVVGKCIRIPESAAHALLNQNAVKLSPCKKLDLGFLYYLLRDERFKAYIVGTAQGAASQAAITLEAIRAYEFELPPLATQNHIASILSAYDDLIENNTRRIAILEEMARRIYEEWFVHFRFPGHENVRMVESELGLIPKGWSSTTLGTLTKFLSRGLTPKYDEEAAGLVINQKCIRDQRLNLELARRQSKQFSKEKLIRFGDVLINSTGVGTLGRVAQVYENVESYTVDTHVTIVRAVDNIDLDYFGLALLSLESHFEQQGVGATGQTELGRQRIGETPIILPIQTIQTKFGTVVRPLRQLIQNLMKKNANLRTTRDLLLPKLISGEIDVSEVRTVAEKAVAA